MIFNKINEPNTTRILIVGCSLAGISVVKPLLDILQKPEIKESGRLFEVVLLDSRRGFINSFAAPRSIIDPEFAKGTYCVFEQMNFPDTENDENLSHITLKSVNGWCVELHERYCQIMNFDEDYYNMEFTYCVYAAGKSKKYPFTPNAYTKNSFIEEMYKTSSDISKADRVLVIGGPDVIGIETAALIKSHYPNKQVGLCFEDDDFPEFDPILFKNLVDLYHDNQEKQKQLKKLQVAQREAIIRNDITSSGKDEKFLKQVFTKLRRLSVSTRNRARSSSRSQSPLSPHADRGSSSSASPIDSHAESPIDFSKSHSEIPLDSDEVMEEETKKLSSAAAATASTEIAPNNELKAFPGTKSNVSHSETEDPILHFRHVLRDQLIELGVELMPKVRPLRSIGFNEYYGEQNRRSSDDDSLRPKLIKYASFDTYSRNIACDGYGDEDETDILSRGLITKDDELIETDVLLWCARDKPNTAAFKKSKLSSCISPITNEVLVDKHGKVSPHSNLFAIGDCSNFDKVLTKNKIFDIPSASMTVSGIVFVGRLIAHNIVRSVFDNELLTIHDFNQLYTEADIDNGLIYNKETIKLYNSIESQNDESSSNISSDDIVRQVVRKQALLNHPMITFPRFIVSLGADSCVSIDPESLVTRVSDPKDIEVISDFRCSLISSLLNITFGP